METKHAVIRCSNDNYKELKKFVGDVKEGYQYTSISKATNDALKRHIALLTRQASKK